MNKTSKASEGIWNFGLIVSVLIANCILFTLIVRTNVNAAEFNISAGDVYAMIDAINEANGNGEEDTINLEAGFYTLTEVNNTNDGNNGLPSITTTIIINGTGDDKTIIESRAFFRIFHIAEIGMLTLKRISVRDGWAIFGGGIFNRGTLNIINSSISNNTASDGSGGGICNRGEATITNSTISGNDAGTFGDGGGIKNSEGTLTITNSTISGNSASVGGGIDNSAPLIIKSSTITDNDGGFGGGGISSSALEFFVKLQNTIIALNDAYQSPNCTRGGAVESLGHNLVGQRGECGFNSDIGDIFANNPMLGPLSDNGGHTFTHALLDGSPAIDAGDDTEWPVTDQRGFPRPIDGNNDGEAVVDIGAYEFGDICEGDFDGDLDVDGSDLATFAAGGTTITLEEFATDFGRTNCLVYE